MTIARPKITQYQAKGLSVRVLKYRVRNPTVKKAETRSRKIREFVEMLARNEKIHEPRRPRRSSE